MPGGDVSAQTPVSSPEEVCASFFSDMPAESDLPQGVSFALTNEPDRCSLSVTATWVTGETPQEKLAALEALDSEADGASESQPLLLLTEPAEGSWDFRFNPEGLQDTADAGGEVPSETAGFEGFMDLIGRAVFEGKTLRVEVELPGDITEHNGTVDGNRVRWELPLFEVFSGEIEPFHAASKTSPSSSEVTQSPETGTQTQPREEILDSAAPSSEPTAAPSERNGSTLLIGAVLGLLLAAVGGGLWFRRR